MGNAASLDAVRRNAQGVDTEGSKRARSEPESESTKGGMGVHK